MNGPSNLARTLHHSWTVSATDGPVPAGILGVEVPTEVPATSHTALLDAGLIPDPFLDTNEAELQWMWRASWRFATHFAATPPTEGERVDLVFDGLDTVASISLNGTPLGETFNMHRSYRFDVRDQIVGGDNRLEVDFASALEYAEAQEATLGFRPRPYPHPYHAIRKMACSFGWDWGPDLQTAGVWKPVHLERWRIARLASVRPLVTVKDGVGHVDVYIEVERAAEEPLTVYASVAGVEAQAAIAPGAATAVVTLEIPRPDLWWPAGYGEPTLYDLDVELHSEDEHLGVYKRKVGFRTVQVDTTPDDIGAPFTFVVNGTPVFVKGANWIPDDILMTRITKDRLARRLEQARGAHLNLIRIWGGGIYETEDFYDICDTLGLMVWQDFPFACSAYAEDAALADEVTAEVRENVTRLASHASLVMYNGSNENIWGFWDWGWKEDLEGRAWGLGYYDDVLPALLAELDPTRAYTPSSPYSPHQGALEMHPNNPDWGPVHEWDVWNRVDYTHYADYVPRFCSEFGFQGPATWATMVRSLPVDELHREHPAWLMHQKAEQGNAKLDGGLAAHLPVSIENFEAWHWETSLNQARAIRFGIEHYRSHWPRCAGAIVWQLNDCWPVTSWAAIDGDERAKPLWFALRQAYAPRLLTFQPRGADGGNDPAGTIHLVAVNDTATDWNETLTFTRMTLGGDELAVATAHLNVPARGAVTLAVPGHVLEPGDRAREVVLADAGYPGDADHVRAIHAFAADKDMAYSGAPFSATAAKTSGGYAVTVTAREFVRDLTVLADKVHPSAVASEALVTLAPGETATISIGCRWPVDPEAFLAPRVLVSVNSIVGAA